MVLEHKKIRGGSPPVVAIWKGSKLQRRVPGGTPVQLAGGMRVVWLLHPESEFFRVVQQNFPLTQAGPVYWTELPEDGGSRQLGEYELVW
jgi:hypothetical protein